MLIPGRHDTTIVKGASWDLTVQWLVTADETPVDLDGWAGVLRIKLRKQSEGALIECSSGNGRLTLDSDGYVIARLTKEQVETLDVGTFFYELELSSGDEAVQLLAGRVKVEP